MKNHTRLNSKTGSVFRAALFFGAAIATVAVGTGYFLTKTRRLEAQLEKAQQEKISNEAERIKAEASYINQKEEFRKIAALNEQKLAIVELQGLEERMAILQTAAKNVRADAEALQTNEAGKKLALRAEHLRQAEHLFERGLAELPSAEVVHSRIEDGKTLIEKLRSAGDSYRPDDDFRARLSAHADFVKDAERTVSSVAVRVNALKASARIVTVETGRPVTETLSDAIKRSKEAEAARLEEENALLIQKAQAEAARGKAITTVREIENSAKIESDKRMAAIEHQRTVAAQAILTLKTETAVQTMSEENTRKEKISAAERARKLIEAQDPAIQAKLQAFLAPGFWQPGDRAPKAVEKSPVSLSRLEASGALARTDKGLALLGEAATYIHNDRPRWERDFGTAKTRAKPAVREELSARQKLLIELGPYFVELKLMAP